MCMQCMLLYVIVVIMEIVIYIFYFNILRYYNDFIVTTPLSIFKQILLHIIYNMYNKLICSDNGEI